MLRLPALLLSLSGVPAFEIVELPRTEGFQTHVFDLNEEGLSVGYMLDDELRWRALQWDGNGAVTELGAPGEWSIARGISEIGIAAGISGPTVGDTEPHVWFAGNEARLPVPADAIGASLLDINDDLVSVGSATVQLGNAATAWVLLTPVTLASPSSSAVEITNAPAAVGSVTVEGFPRAAHWGAGGLTLLPDFGGSSSAAGISPSGLVAGGAFHPGDAKFHAVRWDVAGTTLTDLGLFQTSTRRPRTT